MILSILQRRKWRTGCLSSFVQGCAAKRWQKQDLNPGRSPQGEAPATLRAQLKSGSISACPLLPTHPSPGSHSLVGKEEACIGCKASWGRLLREGSV